MRSLRFRVAAAAFAAVALILIAVGVFLVRGFESSERNALDDRLQQRAGPAGRAVPAAIPNGPPGGPGAIQLGPAPGGPEAGLLRGSDDATRIFEGDRLVGTLGDPRVAGLPVPDRDGFQTVEGDGGPWRTFVASVPDPQGGRIEVLSSLAPLNARVARLRRRLILFGILGLAGTVAVSWVFSTAALRSLERLRLGARGVTTTEDLSVRLPAGDGPDEVDELAASLNAMLERLESSSAETTSALEATRRFAADAGHELRTPLTALGANIETLSRNPALGEQERTRILDALASEQERTVALLDALQALARGDAGAVMPHEPVDVAEVADAALAAARQRHPEAEFSLSGPDEDAGLTGWSQGIRLAIDNLLDNAALHGGMRVELSVDRTPGGVVVRVDDDGPGVPEAERTHLFDRFVRGEAASAPGSGLGLSLVAQQAALHDGAVTIADSPAGGARFEMTLRDA
jgi:two-component system sensor histidine kinase PrrB